LQEYSFTIILWAQGLIIYKPRALKNEGMFMSNEYVRNDSEIILNQAKLAKIFGTSAPTISRAIDQLNIKPTLVSGKSNFYKLTDVRKISQKLFPKDKIIKKNVFTINLHKGGVGKTSVTANLAWFLALLGFKVLIIDLDSQGNLGMQMGFSEEDLESIDKNINKVFDGEQYLDEVIIPVVEGLDIILANSSTAKIAQLLFKEPDADRILQREFAESGVKEQYDYILIDTHSSPNSLLNNAFLVSDEILCVSKCDRFSIKGLNDIYDGLKEFNSFVQSKLNYKVLLNLYESSPDSEEHFLAVSTSNHGNKIYQDVIRKSNDFSNSNTESMPIYSIAKINSNALNDFILFTQEFVRNSYEEHSEDYPVNQRRERKRSEIVKRDTPTEEIADQEMIIPTSGDELPQVNA
jgi:chromosome partitioning protein